MKSRVCNFTTWYKWFAWRPIRVGGLQSRDSYHWAWLEQVERKRAFGFEGISMFANYTYRDIIHKEKPTMTRDELLALINTHQDSMDPEISHLDIEEALLHFINDPEITDAYTRVRRWSA